MRKRCLVLLLFAAPVLMLPFLAGPQEAKVPVPDLEETVTMIRGRIIYNGPVPDLTQENQALQATMQNHKDARCCLAGDASNFEKEQQQWIVNKKGYVANAVVFLRRTDGRSFETNKQNHWPKHLPKKVVLDQPHCQFVPHVLTLYPWYYDADLKMRQRTGQVFEVHNSSPIPHNVRLNGTALLGNTANLILLPGDAKQVHLRPERHLPIPVNCDIHPWMKAYVWVFDHPYAAVSKGHGQPKKDGDFGTYEIRDVPPNVNLKLVAWHLGNGFFLPEGEAGCDVRLRPGEVRIMNLKISK